MFLYLTIYMQGVLDYSPLEAGPALPAADRARLHRRADLRRALATGSRSGSCSAPGWRLVGVGLLLMHGVSPDSELDDAAGRLPRRRHRHRHHQPRHRPGGDRRRAGRRSRGWARGSTRPSARSGSPPASPALGAVFQSRVDSKLAELLPHAPARARRSRRLGRLARGRRAAAAAGDPRRSRPRRRRRLRQRLQRDHPDRRDPLLRRRRARLRPGPLAATSCSTTDGPPSRQPAEPSR